MKFRYLYLMGFILLIFLQTAHALNDSSVRIDWGYKGNIGPERWAQLDPSFLLCAQGKSQSPISIENKIVPVKDGLRIKYSPAPLNVINDGTTNLMLGREQTVIEDGHSIQVNFAPMANETILYNGKQFRLIQFHVHTPSENVWHGQSFPVEIHFVHQGENGTVVVIGVFAKGGTANKELQKFVDHLPEEKNKSLVVSGESINPIHLFPGKLNYYSFPGSLTTPPCTEGVQWIVMSEPITVSPAQIARLRKAVGGNNARPVQPLNGRTINSVTYTNESLNNKPKRVITGTKT